MKLLAVLVTYHVKCISCVSLSNSPADSGRSLLLYSSPYLCPFPLPLPLISSEQEVIALRCGCGTAAASCNTYSSEVRPQAMSIKYILFVYDAGVCEIDTLERAQHEGVELALL